MSTSTTNSDTTSPVSPPPTSSPDLGGYATDLAELNLTADQERELLETLWRIMHAFVDMGFRVDICEQLFPEFNEAVAGDSHALDSPASTTELPRSVGKESLHDDY